MSLVKQWLNDAYSNLTWAEVSGSVGDLGTFLPLLIGLVQKVDLDLGTTLIVTGAYNIISGLQFGIPMCVQPMKTLAAVALASTQPSLTLPQLLLAGIFVSGCVLVLGASRLVDLFNWLVPPPVVRGVQLAVGAKLAMKGVDMALRHHVAAGSGSPSASSSSPPGSVHWRPWLGSEGLLLGLAALALLVASTVPPRAASPGSPTAAEDGGLGPRPTDTPFEPLLARLFRGRGSRTPAGHAVSRATTTAGGSSGSSSGTTSCVAARAERLAGVAEQRDSSGTEPGDGFGYGGGRDGGGGRGSSTETCRLLGEGAGGPDGDGDGEGNDPEAAQPLASAARGPSGASKAVPAETGDGLIGGCSGGGASGQGAGRVPAVEGPWGCGGGGGLGGCHGSGSRRQVPSALIAILVGLVLAVASQPGILSTLRLGPTAPHLLRPTWRDFREGTLRAGLAQLPLTTLNSVIAVTQLADSLFPDRRDSARWRPSSVALSVSLLNLAGCWLGTMPCCHGAGGLAAQYKFGARTGAAPVLLGCLKAALGLLFGGSLMALLQRFPQPLLGALLVVSGVELATSLRHTKTLRGYTFALLTAVAILGLDNTGLGFVAGMGAVVFVAAYEALLEWMERCWAARRRADTGI